MYDPDGDEEETLPERHGELAGEAGGDGEGGEQGTAGSGLPYASPVARQEELEAMAAAAAPGGLAAQPRRPASGGGGGGVAPHDHPLLAAGVGDGAAAAAVAGESGSPGQQPDAEGGVDGVADNAVAVGGRNAAAGVEAVAAPAADGWGLATGGGGELSGGTGSAGVNGDHGGGGPAEGGGGGGGGGRRRGRRYFGLLSRDEWIPASSSRIEKLNSRAPWKNSWTEEAPVNDRADPYLTEDGSHLVFAVPRAPVDGAPCLVSGCGPEVSGRWKRYQPMTGFG